MIQIFVDTSAWYAIVDRNDPDHKSARKFLKLNRFPLITTNFVFDEIITLMRKKLGWTVAKQFGEKLKESTIASIYSVESEDEADAWDIFRRYEDKDFSFTDCTSFAIMKKLGIVTAFGFDDHFLSMGFFLVPK